MSAIEPDMPVGQIVSDRFQRAAVLEHYGIDYCCHGTRSLVVACAEKGLDTGDVLEELRRSDARSISSNEIDWAHAPLPELADHIVAVHHAYLRKTLPSLGCLLDKVVLAHGVRHPTLAQLRRVYFGLVNDLALHMLKEEHVLFPLIRRLTAGRKQDRSMVTDEDLTNLLSSLEDDHAEVGDALARMCELTDGYQAPANACATYRAALDGLAELESDIHEHVHKENNILFPQTSDMLRRMALVATHD